jgi:predicted RNA-binding protein YlqC (UPF0109 family)
VAGANPKSAIVNSDPALESALEHLVKGIVANPSDVHVALRSGRRGRSLEVRVAPDDLGRVIGRNGRTAKALRQVMAALGGRDLRVDVLD